MSTLSATKNWPDAAPEQPPAKTRKIKWYIFVLVTVVILVGFALWVWIKVYNNRKFNRRLCPVGKAPFIMSMKDDMTTYYKRAPVASPEPLPSGRYEYETVETVGLDLEKFKTGDLIMSRFVRGKQKTEEYDRICQLFKNPPPKTWQDSSMIKRIKHFMDKEAMHHYYTGKSAPTHVCMVGRVARVPGKKLQPSDIQIWNIAWEGRETITLDRYMDRYPCTMAKYWVVHLNRTAPDVVVDMVEEYAEKVSPPQYWYRSLGTSYLRRSRGISLSSRSAFFEASKTVQGECLESEMSNEMLGLDATKNIIPNVGPDPKNQLCPIIYTCHDTQVDLDHPVVERELTDGSPTYGWSDWKGLDHVHYSCSGLIYAYLEAFGLVLPMHDALSLKRIPSGDKQVIVPGDVKRVTVQDVVEATPQEEGALRTWRAQIHFDPTARLRIMAPQTLAPCDFFRGDFQWAEGVHVQFASRFYYVDKT